VRLEPLDRPPSLLAPFGDATFDELRKHFSEREIAEIVVENAKSNFYDLLNVPLDIPDDGLLAIAERRAGKVN